MKNVSNIKNLNFSTYSDNLRVSAFYFNSIGILQILISDFPEFLKENLDKTKILNKCEDGILKILLKFSDNNFCEFSIYISKSMVVKLQHTQIKINKSKGIIEIRYFTIKNLLNPEKIIQKFEFYLSNFSEIFESTDGFKNSSKIDLKNIFNSIHTMNCKNCSNSIVKGFDKTNCILAFNFNYDYIENLEMLSCHESDLNNVIPNLENELKRIINFTFFKVQIPIEIINSEISMNCDKFLNEIKCGKCKLKIGEFTNKFFSFDITLINFTSLDHKTIQISLSDYIETLVYFCVTQNKKVLSLSSHSESQKNQKSLLINSSFLFSACDLIKLNQRNEKIKENFIKTVYAEIVSECSFIDKLKEISDDQIQIQFLKEDYAQIIEQIKIRKKEFNYLIRFLNTFPIERNLNPSQNILNEKEFYLIKLD